MARGLEGVDPSIFRNMLEGNLEAKELKVSFSTLSPCFSCDSQERVRLAQAPITITSPVCAFLRAYELIIWAGRFLIQLLSDEGWTPEEKMMWAVLMMSFQGDHAWGTHPSVLNLQVDWVRSSLAFEGWDASS